MTVLIVVALLVPVILFGSYRIQRAQVLRAAHRATDQGNRSTVALGRGRNSWSATGCPISVMTATWMVYLCESTPPTCACWLS